MQVIAFISSKVEFKRWRDIFELKDQVQGDGTNDYYKHFALYQYVKMIGDAIEAKWIDREIGDKDVIAEIDRSVRNQAKLIEKTHGIKIDPE